MKHEGRDLQKYFPSKKKRKESIEPKIKMLVISYFETVKSQMKLAMTVTLCLAT